MEANAFLRNEIQGSSSPLFMLLCFKGPSRVKSPLFPMYHCQASPNRAGSMNLDYFPLGLQAKVVVCP